MEDAGSEYLWPSNTHEKKQKSQTAIKDCIIVHVQKETTWKFEE